MDKLWTAALCVLALAAATLMLLGSTACNPYAVAWRTLDGVQKARDLTAQQLAQAARAKHADCKKEHGAQTPEFASCIKKHRAALEQWRKNIRPAVNSGIQITATALQIAERTKGSDKVDWIAVLKPAVCALSRAVRSWAHYFPDKGKAILGALRLAEGVTCGK